MCVLQVRLCEVNLNVETNLGSEGNNNCAIDWSNRLALFLTPKCCVPVLSLINLVPIKWVLELMSIFHSGILHYPELKPLQ
ncbi:hypothetical protein TSMEX_008768 [Taenia solium]|eukprot:TsM_000289100 transcript=TsM_000289100 gene=TsM_000289100